MQEWETHMIYILGVSRENLNVLWGGCVVWLLVSAFGLALWRISRDVVMHLTRSRNADVLTSPTFLTFGRCRRFSRSDVADVLTF